MKRFFLSFLFNLLLVCFSFSQQRISGTVLDKNTREPLVGASVTCGKVGAISNVDGQFILDVEEDCTVEIQYLGYNVYRIKASQVYNELIVEMDEITEILDLTTVTASKFEQRLSESTVSVDVLKPALLKSINTIKTDELLNKLPGVQVIDGQANIRGGSGFSYGAGSRVMLLLDDMPALQVDAGVANWGDLPIEMVGQIEVVKGASSALYGSSALNGIIHFRRQTPGIKPETNVFTSYTSFMDFDNPEYKWYGDTLRPYRFNIGVSHTRKIGKLDLSTHGFFTKNESYNKNTYETAGRGGLNLKYKLKENVYVGLNSIFNRFDKSDFFIWEDAISGILKPFPGTISFGKRTRANVDPYLHIYQNNGAVHKINTRYLYTNNDNNANQQNKSHTYYTEYQFSKTFEKYGLNFVTGVVNTINDSEAELFGGETFLYRNSAAYIQFDKKFGDKLSASFGFRYEYNKQNSPDSIGGFVIPGGVVKDSEPISRLGINYKLNEYGSVRASYGQGYRYPTITERFIQTQFGGFFIFPNPLLLPEYGWTAELGFKQGLKIDAFKGFIDLAAFMSEYEDMIEFTFLENPFGFKPFNVGNTRITGYEAAINGQIDIMKDMKINLLTGYTYINPIYKNYNDRKELRDNLSTTQNVLKYRSKHTAKVDAELVYKFLSLGFSTQYYSHLINVDKRFEEPVGGFDLFQIKAFRQINNKGFTLIDARLGLSYKDYKLSFLVNNIKNTAYTVRPGLLEDPRNFTFRLDAKF